MTKERILVIDDDAYIRNACTDFLKSVGYDTLSAESGEKGVEILEGGNFNMVITDFKMPGMDGLDVLKHVKATSPNTDVIVITAHGTIENAVQAMKLGAYDYLTKNFDLDELDIIVKRCLEKQRLSAEVHELKELVNLYEVSKAISSIMGLNELLELILKLVCDTLSADGGSIMLYEPQSEELVVKVVLGKRKEIVMGRKLKIGERIAGYAARLKQTITIQGSLKHDERFAGLEEFDKIKSSMSVPLLRKSRLLGVINLNRTEKDVKFNLHDSNLLSIFAVEAAIAIENTYLFNKLEEEKEELNATFSGMADGAILTDEQLNIIRFNKSTEELLGISQKESIGRNLIQIISNFEPSVSWEEIRKKTEQTISFELVRKNGKTLFLGALATKIRDQEDNLIGQIIVIRNITDEKKEERQKMDFLALISHKLKTPLTAINGFSALLLDKSKDLLDDKITHSLQLIEKQGDLLNTLVDKLLRFSLLVSEYTSLNQKQTPADAIFEKCLKGLRNFIEINHADIIVDAEVYKLPQLWVDSMKTTEVLENLIENAIKFNDKAEKSVRITCRLFDERFVIIEVIDNGPGIPSEEQSKIFKKFYQIDEYITGQVQGVGLGLALVRQIVELHGGKVWVESKMGEGSKFSITLPIWTNQSDN